MSAAVVRRLKGRAVIADPVTEVRRARRRAISGDRAWRERLEGYERGDIVIAQLTAVAVMEDAAARLQIVPCCHATVWIDRRSAREVAEEHLREIARRDFQDVGDGLRDHRGVQIDDDAISVEIEMQAELAQVFVPDLGR